MWLVGHWNLSWSWALWTRRMSHEHVWWIEAWCWGITRCGMGEGWRWDIKMTGTIWKVQMQTSYWPGRNAIESLRRKIRPSEDLGMKCFSVNLQKFDSQMICSKSFPFEHIFQVFPCFWWKARSKASKVNLFGIPRPRSVHAMLEFIGWKIIGVWKPWMEAPGWMVNDFNQDGAMMPRCPKVGWNGRNGWKTPGFLVISQKFHVERWPLTHETIHDAYPEPHQNPPSKKFGKQQVTPFLSNWSPKGPNKKPADFLWNLEKSTKISQTTQLSSTLYSERLSIFRFREERANWYKVRSKNIHPRNLTNRYQKWWYRYQTCISFQICLFWVSILNFGRGICNKIWRFEH